MFNSITFFTVLFSFGVLIYSTNINSGVVVSIYGGNISRWDVSSNTLKMLPIKFPPNPNNYTYTFTESMTVDTKEKIVYVLIVTEVQKNFSVIPCQSFTLYSYVYANGDISFLRDTPVNLHYCYTRTGATYPFIFWDSVNVKLWMMYFTTTNVISSVDLFSGDLGTAYPNGIYNGFWGGFYNLLVYPYILTLDCYWDLTAFNLQSLVPETTFLRVPNADKSFDVSSAVWYFDLKNQTYWLAAIGELISSDDVLLSINATGPFSDTEVTSSKVFAEDYTILPWFVYDRVLYWWNKQNFMWIGINPMTGQQVYQSQTVPNLQLGYKTMIFYDPTTD